MDKIQEYKEKMVALGWWLTDCFPNLIRFSKPNGWSGITIDFRLDSKIMYMDNDIADPIAPPLCQPYHPTEKEVLILVAMCEELDIPYNEYR